MSRVSRHNRTCKDSDTQLRGDSEAGRRGVRHRQSKGFLSRKLDTLDTGMKTTKESPRDASSSGSDGGVADDRGEDVLEKDGQGPWPESSQTTGRSGGGASHDDVSTDELNTQSVRKMLAALRGMWRNHSPMSPMCLCNEVESGGMTVSEFCVFLLLSQRNRRSVRPVALDHESESRKQQAQLSPSD